jgi:diguanylate cyclase (GGDEF)-like protein/PAS domain S-box-containing protein
LVNFKNGSRVRSVAPVLIAGIIGIVASISVWRLTANSEDRTFALEYAQRADNQASVLRSGIADYFSKLYAVRALLESSTDATTRDEFEDFSKSLLADRPGILNLSWIPRVKRDERAAHELAAVRDGLSDYHIRAIASDGNLPVSPEHDEYYPKFYSTEARNSRAYGLDNKDGGVREEAIAHIRDANVLSVSPPLVLHIGNGDRRGFWAGLPVYARGLPHETIDERRRNLLGVVQGVFQIGIMIDTIFAGITSPVQLYLFAPHAAMSDAPIYSTSHLGTETMPPKSQADLAAGLHRSYPLNLGDVPWTMVFTRQLTNANSIRHERSLILLIGGLLLTASLTSFIWAVRRGSQRAQLAAEQSRQQKIVLDTALENMLQGLCMFDADGHVILFNDRYTKLLGWEAETLNGRNLVDMIRHRKASGEFAGDPEEFVKNVIADARAGKSNIRLIKSSAGRTLRVVQQSRRGGGWVSTVEDISEALEAQAQISYMAHHDTLTGLANRTQLIEKVESALAVPLPIGGRIAVHFIDLDRFKSVNDTFGHDGGDFLLKTVAERLRAVTRDGDIVARLGGDEFVVVQTGVKGKDQAEEFARRLTSAVTAPIKHGAQAIIATISIGVAVAPTDGNSAERLLKSADLALYKAKADGRNCVRFFLPEMDTELSTRFVLERTVRDAVQHSRFELHYQPLFEISDRRLIGFEALIRLPAEDGTLIPPLVFIPIAEDLGLIDRIGAWVLQEACRVAATWPHDLTVAVNLSPAQFLLGSVSDIVASALRESGLESHRLELEVNEALLLGNSEAIMAELKTIKAMGVTIVMDDFGTGCSSLGYLWRFPFDKIKIDRSFMQGFDGSGRDVKTVVKTIINLGRQLNMRVTVEGVESAKQAAFIDQAEGDQVQGFFFGRPLPASDVSATILANFRKIHESPSYAAGVLGKPSLANS